MIGDYLDMADIADRLGVKVTTVRQYKLRGDLPAPDGQVGRSPVWRQQTISEWMATRPGQGWRKGQKGE
jgi:predicted DNA-binding transcriptional regulator AlpA